MSIIRNLIVILVGISLAILITMILLDPSAIAALALNLSEASVLIRLPLAILLVLLIIAVIVVFVRSGRPAGSASGLIVKAQGAIADISIDSARDRMLRAVRAVPDVIAADADLKAVRGKADVDLNVVVSRESSSLPEKQREIDRALRQVVQKELGLQLAGKPRVHIRMDTEPAAAQAPVAPEPPPALPLPSQEATHTETIIEPEAAGDEPIRVETVSYGDTPAGLNDRIEAADGETDQKAASN